MAGKERKTTEGKFFRMACFYGDERGAGLRNIRHTPEKYLKIDEIIVYFDENTCPMKPPVLFILIPLCMCCSYTGGQDLETVQSVDLEKYLGLWYEIASFPAGFQKGCRCSTAEYQQVPNRKYIRVINKCLKIKSSGSKMSFAKGKAFVVKGSGNARLKVQFLWPFRGDYYIIVLDDDYRYVVVGHPARKYLWILSREPYMSSGTYSGLVERVKDKGYDISRLQKTEQNCEDK
jgi:apolipoprotein D and lipocalin family protein